MNDLILFLDTETSAGWDFKSANDADHQPRLVQLGALVMDGSGKEVACFDAIVQPDGWLMSDEVTKIHGITHERAERCGLPINVVMAVLSNLARLCITRVAFNIDFDDRVIAREFSLLGKTNLVHELTKPFCMMKTMTPICKIPKPAYQNYNKSDPYKWPKLQEAYQFAFKKDFDNAHSAIADIRATAELYFWSIGVGKLKEGELKL